MEVVTENPDTAQITGHINSTVRGRVPSQQGVRNGQAVGALALHEGSNERSLLYYT